MNGDWAEGGSGECLARDIAGIKGERGLLRPESLMESSRAGEEVPLCKVRASRLRFF